MKNLKYKSFSERLLATMLTIAMVAMLLPTAAFAVTSIIQPSAITGLSNGVEKTSAGLTLPATVSLKTSNSNKSAPVKWDVEGCSYDPSTTTAQTFIVNGTVTLPSGVTNSNSVGVTVTVCVSASRTVDRVSGSDRFRTAKAIAEQINNKTVNDVILATGYNFPDALCGSVLANKIKAPILLVDSTVEGSTAAFQYIQDHLSMDGTVHLLGGTGVISEAFIAKLNLLGYQNIERIGGDSRFATNLLLVQKIEAAVHTPVVIATAENYPDVLSMASVASYMGWPVLLSGPEGLTQEALDFLNTHQPTQIYLVGGTGVLPDSIIAQLQSVTAGSVITRLAGQDRYATAEQILDTFTFSKPLHPEEITVYPKNIYLASGNNFPDALAGGVLSSTTGELLILVDKTQRTVSEPIRAYLGKLADVKINPNIIILGGPGAVPDSLVQNVKNLLDGLKIEAPSKEVINYQDLGSMTVLVNKEHHLPVDYVPTDLVEVNIPFTFSEKTTARLMRKEAAEKLAELFTAGKKEKMILYGVSGYRSYLTQQGLFARFTKSYGSEEKANQISARAGESEHQTGLAMDVSSQSVSLHLAQQFGDTKEYSWLKENAHTYGFIIRYLKGKEAITEYMYEPWHLRYVGKELATQLYEQKITYEEYLSIRI